MPEPAYERLGAKVLTLPGVIAQSVGFMGPVFSAGDRLRLHVPDPGQEIGRHELSDLAKSTT